MKSNKTKNGVNIRSTVGMKAGSSPKIWVLLADRSSAQVFEQSEKNGALKSIKTIPFPEGRAKGRDLLTDRPGRTFDGGRKGRGNQRSSLEMRSTVDEQKLSAFSQKVNAWLEHSRKKHAFDELRLVADPKVLGSLKTSMSKTTAKLLTGTIEKDLVWMKKGGLENRLETLLRA